MPRISLPPFLKKLQTVTEVVDAEIAHWSEDGTIFIVEKSEEFEKVLAQYFKGSLLTFIRQLHFYGFRKVDIKGGKWSFSHKCFKRGMEHLIYEIRRKTRTETNDGVASQLEVQALRDHVSSLHETIGELKGGLKELKEELAILRRSVKRDAMKAELSTDFDFDCISNGADIMSKKQKTFESEIKKITENSKLEPLSDNDSLGSYKGSVEDFASYLPFTDSAFDAATTDVPFR